MKFHTSSLALAALLLPAPALTAREPAFPLNAQRIVFLGDSITHAGHFISLLEAELRLAQSGPPPELINLGLPSETCSGLSEPDHPFPRPNVQERIGRALALLKPDVVVACYGMNDGIYHPFNEQRFAAYQAGIAKIISQVQASGAKLILLTPPAFDPLPLKKQGKLLPLGADKYAWFNIYEDYDDVMRRYAAWVMKQRNQVAMVIDLHTTVRRYVTSQRNSDPEFTMSPDGVHLNQEGHRVLAQKILQAWGCGEMKSSSREWESLISRRQQLLHSAWLSAVGHQRPGVQAGLPIQEALRRAAEMEKEIRNRRPDQS